MTDILTNSASIPYGTWGGRSLTQSRTISIPASNVPYTYSPLTSNIYISTDMTDVVPDTRPVITNMAEYARFRIPNYRRIAEIPNGHLPTDINTSTAKNWYMSFYDCTNLTSLPDPFYDTSNAINMHHMLSYCENLTTIPNFDTSNVTDMCRMFSTCNNLTTIPNFDTSNVTDMCEMFYMCNNLTTIPNFDTSNVTDMCEMFYMCNNITTVPNFDTSNVTDISDMFRGCSNLISVPDFKNALNIVEIQGAFYGCINLKNFPNFDRNLKTGYNCQSVFYNCRLLEIAPVFDTSNTGRIDYLFYNCSNLKSFPIINTAQISDAGQMVAGCTNLRGDIYITGSYLDYTYDMFANMGTTYRKNVYADPGNFDTLCQKEFAGTTYLEESNVYLYDTTKEYAEIPWNGAGIYRFPTNKIEVLFYGDYDGTGTITNTIMQTIEVSPYTDYELYIGVDVESGFHPEAPTTTYAGSKVNYYITHGNIEDYNNHTLWGEAIATDVYENGYYNFSNMKFRFFKDIPNMSANVVDLL